MNLDKNLENKSKQEKTPNNEGVDFEINSKEKFEQYKDAKINKIDAEPDQIKNDGANRLNSTASSYELPEEDVEATRKELHVDDRLESVSSEIDELTEDTKTKISEVGNTENKEAGLEKESTIESFQEKRGTMLAKGR